MMLKEPIRIMQKDKNGKEKIIDLYDLELIENEDGSVSVSGSYVPTYDEIFDMNYKMARAISEAIEYIENEDIDVCTIRNNDIQDTKQKLLDILKGSDSNE